MNDRSIKLPPFGLVSYVVFLWGCKRQTLRGEEEKLRMKSERGRLKGKVVAK